MAEQIFRSPNFYEREIVLSTLVSGSPVGTPAGVIGSANKGPAFIPITFANFAEFVTKFGNLDTKHFGPYAVNEFLKNRTSLTYLRVLGAGANSTFSDFSNTATQGTVKNAGFSLYGDIVDPGGMGNDSRHTKVVQFIAGQHTVSANEAYGMPMFSDNDTFSIMPGGNVNLIRGIVMVPSTARIMILDGDEATPALIKGINDEAKVKLVNGKPKVKIIISSSLGVLFSNDDAIPGIKILTASFDPSADDYFAKILNSDPDKFYSNQHFLAADFAVDSQIANVTTNNYVAILSGSGIVNTSAGNPTLNYRQIFGSYDTRFQAPRTPTFISQPFGNSEYDLFSLEAIDDGEYANQVYKISITNLKASVDDTDKYGTFTIQIRDWNDTDISPVIIEQFMNCSLDTNSSNYVAKLIGDRKLFYHFDAIDSKERRLTATGKYANRSQYVRIVMSDIVEKKLLPALALPFGFRGLSLLKTNNNLNSLTPLSSANTRLGAGDLTNAGTHFLSGSVLPPIPYRYKVTRGEVSTLNTKAGYPGTKEVIMSSLYWGVKFERNSLTFDNEVLNPNVISEKNNLIGSLTRFMGIEKLDALHTGSNADLFNNNKFSLAKVAFGNTSINDVTGSVSSHMKEAAYIRNAIPNSTDYTVSDGVVSGRVTFATLLSKATSKENGLTVSAFNRFSSFTKFTTFMYGGFDGTNYLDRDARRLNDKSVSFNSDVLSTGGAATNYIPQGFTSVVNGTGKNNSSVISYDTAIDIMTDPYIVGTNIITIPGIREPYINDLTSKKVKDYGLAIHLMDIPPYSDEGYRLYDDSTFKTSVKKTIDNFDARNIDNNYVSTYFPDVYIDDTVNHRRIKVPATVAALGALGFNDRVSYPWFAPAGFNRAALDFVKNVSVRLNVSDRDSLYESRINPIATFPRLGFVIYGQKTLQISKSALDRVNVRRLLLEVKRTIIGIANRLVFEQNTPTVRNRFVADSTFQLGLVQTQAGIEAFNVVMNETNNTQEDVDLSRLNGRIVVVPTRSIEFIALDFIITNSGVVFV